MMGSLFNFQVDLLEYPVVFGDLMPAARELICTLEDLLILRFLRKLRTAFIEHLMDPRKKEIAKVLIGYYYIKNARMIGNDPNVFQWLHLDPSDIPRPCEIFRKLRDPSFINEMCKHSVLNTAYPTLAMDTANPVPDRFNLNELVNTCRYNNTDKIVYLVTLNNVLQLQVRVTLEVNNFNGSLSYGMVWTIGRMNSVSTAHDAAPPYGRPMNLPALIYNAGEQAFLGFNFI